MKPSFLFPYWCRYLGYAFIVGHVPIAIIARWQGIDMNSNGPGGPGLFTGEHLFFMCTALLMTIGLFLVAFAKEQIEDEQIWQIRPGFIALGHLPQLCDPYHQPCFY